MKVNITGYNEFQGRRIMPPPWMVCSYIRRSSVGLEDRLRRNLCRKVPDMAQNDDAKGKESLSGNVPGTHHLERLVGRRR